MMKKILMFLFILSLISFSCKVDKHESLSIPQESQIFGLATPVPLDIEKTTIYLNDYFTNPDLIDSFKYDKNLSVKELQDSSKLELAVLSDSLPELSTLDVFIEGYKYSLLLKKSNKIKYKFVFDAKGKQYSSVKIKGEMNAWNGTNSELTSNAGVWSIDLILEKGQYQYLLILDGEEHLDPNNSDSISNNMGGYNSLLTVGANDETKVPYLFTSTFTDDSIKIKYDNKISDIVVFYENYQLPKSYIKKSRNFITFKIPEQAKNLERSYFRVWAYNKFGTSNDIKIPLQKGRILTDVKDLKRTDYEAAVIYNVFIDRFFDGNPDNNRPINNSDEVLQKADYQGGDIDGVMTILHQGYFDSLGINTIWLSPIVKNVEGAWGHWDNPETKFSAYHGYWPMSLTKIDDRFGTPDEFKTLVNDLHQDNKNIILDFIAHHLHENSPIIKQHPDWITDLYLPDGSLNTEHWDDKRLTTWFDVFLPTLDNRKPEVANFVSDSALFWLTEYGIDGFRHDAAKHVPLTFWRTSMYKIKRQVEIPNNKKLYQIGETYGSHALVGSYVNSGMLDAQFDFNLYDAFSTAFSVQNSFKNLQTSLNKSFKYFGCHNLMGNITGNQDRGRFISYATGTLKYDEDAKAAGWQRDITVGDTTGYLKSAMLFAFINTIPGIPVIYYGDEIGMPGGNDPDNRRMMRFDNLNNNEIELKNTVSKLIKLRRSSMPLIFGDFKFLLVQDSVMAYQRSYFNEVAIVVFNNTNQTKFVTVPLDSNFNYDDMKAEVNCCFSVSNNKLSFEMKPFSFDIFTNAKTNN